MMKNRPFVSGKTASAKGYSLIEMSIVLGVAGLIIAAIWATASYVHKVVRREQVYEQVNSFVMALRNNYQNRAGIESTESIHRLIVRGVVPADMVRNPGGVSMLADHALAGEGVSSYVPNALGDFQFRFSDTAGNLVASAASDPLLFGLSLHSLSLENCIQILTNLSGSKSPSGLVRVSFDGGSTTTFPVSPGDAMNNCAGGWIGFSYHLRNR